MKENIERRACGPFDKVTFFFSSQGAWVVGPYWKNLGEMILIRGQNICSMMNCPLSFHTILVMMDGL